MENTMASESTGAKGQPYFAASGAPQIDVDPGIVADYAALVGNRKIGTTAQRLALTGVEVWPDLHFGDTTNGNEYRRTSTGSWEAIKGIYRATGSTGSLGTTMSVVAAVTLPAGTWQITAHGSFEWSTAAPQKYTLQLWNSTAGAEIDTMASGPTVSTGNLAVYVEDTVLLSVASVIQLRASTNGGSGSQLYGGGKLFATRAVLV